MRRLFPVFGSIPLLVACSDDGRSPEQELDPPELSIISLSGTSGDPVNEPGSTVELSCDRLLFVGVGPREAGLLPNWVLRPTGNCGNVTACGYLKIEALAADGSPLAKAERPLVEFPLDLLDTDLDRIASVRVTLIQGNEDEPYEFEGETTQDSWPVSVQAPSGCQPQGLGGQGGAGG